MDVILLALDLTLPIPDRYVMVSDPGDACISFSAPAGTLLRQATDPALVQLQHGLISYCALDELDRDMEEMGRKALPTTAYEWRGLSVQEWNPSSVNRHHITYIKSATEALLIQDMNPLLWNAMRQFIERTNC